MTLRPGPFAKSFSLVLHDKFLTVHKALQVMSEASFGRKAADLHKFGLALYASQHQLPSSMMSRVYATIVAKSSIE